jgi:hypothetical protein
MSLHDVLISFRAGDITAANKSIADVLKDKVRQRIAEERCAINGELLEDEKRFKQIFPTEKKTGQEALWPTNWDKAFTYPYRIGGGGSETPFQKNGKWYLYVWNAKDGKHYIYDYSADAYLPDTALSEDSIPAAITPKLPDAPDKAPCQCVDASGNRCGLNWDHVCADNFTTKTRGNKQTGWRVPPRGHSEPTDLTVAESVIKGFGMPKTEVQRVYDEVGDQYETEVLCGVSRLHVDTHGRVTNFDHHIPYVDLDEAVDRGLNIHGAPMFPVQAQGTIGYAQQSEGITAFNRGDRVFLKSASVTGGYRVRASNSDAKTVAIRPGSVGTVVRMDGNFVIVDFGYYESAQVRREDLATSSGK